MALTIPNLDETVDFNEFIRNYRNSLTRQYDTSMATIDNQRRLNEASIMSQANRAGMMYSNLPQRSKMQYVANTYSPAMTSIAKTYQTGKDKLRSNAVSVMNDIKSIEDAIHDLNTYGLTSSNGNNGVTGYGYPLTTNQATDDATETAADTTNYVSTLGSGDSKKVISIAKTGNNMYDVVTGDGKRHSVNASSESEAASKVSN